MFCPNCEGEFLEGVTRCARCDVDLVAELSQPDHPDVELVTVFRGGNPSDLAVVGSLLEEQGIRYLKKGEGLQDLFGPGRIGGLGFSLAMGPVEVQVNRPDAELALKILAPLGESEEEVPD